MPKKKTASGVDHCQGFVMTSEGLLVPGKFLRQMGHSIAISFSDQLIVISADRASPRIRKGPSLRTSSKRIP